MELLFLDGFKENYLKREVFSDAQALRTRFYSCSEDRLKKTARSQIDFRHQGDWSRAAANNESELIKQEKARLIQKGVRKTARRLRKRAKNRQ